MPYAVGVRLQENGQGASSWREFEQNSTSTQDRKRWLTQITISKRWRGRVERLVSEALKPNDECRTVSVSDKRVGCDKLQGKTREVSASGRAAAQQCGEHGAQKPKKKYLT